MEPLDALETLIQRAVLVNSRGRPGEIVARANPEQREALTRLTSADTAQARVPEYVCRTSGRRGRASVDTHEGRQ